MSITWAKAIGAIIIGAGAIFILGALIITSSLGRPSHCIVDSVETTLVSFTEKDSLGITRFSDCPSLSTNNQKVAILAKPTMHYEPSKTGTYQPGILGIKDSISEIKLYLITSGLRRPLAIQPLRGIDHFRVFDCNKNLSPFDDRQVVYTNRDTSYLRSDVIPETDDYID